MKKLLFAGVLSLLAFPAWAGDGVGTLKDVTGIVRVTHVAADTPIQDMKQGDPVFMDDVIETQAGAKALIVFHDDTQLTVTGQGRVVIDEYVYDPAKAENNKASIDILGAAFSYVGGMIDKGEKRDVNLNLDYGSIGIRGTTVYGALRNGLDWVYLEKGAVTVSNKGGETKLGEGFGTRMSSADEMPAPAYQWDEQQAAWIKNLVADPAAHETQAMAFNEDRRTKEAERRQATAASSESGPSAGGGAPSRAADEELGAARAPASPAASAPPVLAPGQAAKAKQAAAPQTVLHTWDGAIEPKTKGAARVATVDLSKQEAGGTLIYSAELQSAAASGPAYLEMWVHIAGKGYVFARSPAKELPAGGDWQSFTAQLPLTAKPDKAILHLVLNGPEKVLVRNLRLLR